MRIIRKLKDIKYNIKYAFQRARKGYSDYDLFSMNGWFLDKFPKMLGEFANKTIGHPCCEDLLRKGAKKFPKDWVKQQDTIILDIYKKHNRELKLDLEDSMYCWLLIILRMKYCFEMSDEFNKNYDCYWENKDHDIIQYLTEQFKAEGCELFKEWFFNLWW